MIERELTSGVECFYNRDGKWYYAGVYRTFRMDDLVTQEWDNLCHEATQALIKETLSGRKNVSPQNVYETGQLYAVGALKVACIGLQCIGFNNTLYRTILDHAAKCAQTGKWRSTMAGGGHSPGMTWTTNSNSHSPNAEAFGGTVSSKANEGNSSIQNPLNGGSSGSEDVTLGKINNA
ncbi:hypothetical protein AcV5_005571 [Taiwanofungus camphoratus]|nr:hypothetical protein AcV5_005571 [Antrodia cinnamomea]